MIFKKNLCSFSRQESGLAILAEGMGLDTNPGVNV